MRPLLTGDGSRTLHSTNYRQTYHSTFGAVTEARLVYLQASGAAARIRSGHSCKILEIGFGLGLNFLLTADLANSIGTRLEYVGVELAPVTRQQFGLMNYDKYLLEPKLCKLVDCALESTAGRCPNYNGTINLTVQCEDIRESCFARSEFDIVYLDAFSPDVNPECWTESQLYRYHRWLKTGGKLSSFCVRGELRRCLQSTGFQVEKISGPPGKREILIATRL